MNINISEKSNFIWKIADILRGDYKQSEYGDVILPFTVLCRLDSVLAPTKDAVLNVDRTCKYKNKAPFLKRATQTPSTPGGYNFWNTSEFTFAKLKGDPDNIADNLRDYIKGFSENARTILESFDIYSQIARLDKANLLWLVVCKFVDDIDLHPDMVSNNEMGYIFEELIRKFSEMSNETAGEHFTPREVIRLMVSILFCPDMEKIKDSGYMAKLYDPAAGTGGMLSAGIEYTSELNDRAIIEVYGQELNEKTYAICKSDTMIKGKGYENIHLGNSFTDDALPHETFHYMLCNPPFGVEWKKYEKFIRDENENNGYTGRFGAGLPRVSDGSLLFLQHMISKMMPVHDGGCRIGIVFSGSPLITGDAGSGESEIRRWIIENDYLEAIVALPEQLFFKTPILTFIWIVTNRKSSLRKGKIQLIDGTSFFQRMRKPLWKKRRILTEEHIADITRIYGDFVDGEFCKVFNNEDFEYKKITIERPLRLNFQTSLERIYRIREQTAFVNLATSRKRKPEDIAREVAQGQKMQEDIIAAVGTLDSTKLYKNRPEFTKLLQKAFKKAELDVKAPLLKAILMGLSEKDETADICFNSKGKPEPDADLRDTKNLARKETIEDYMAREVLPYISDAWVDHAKTKKGYEIPFTRLFYKYSDKIISESASSKLKAMNASISEHLNQLAFDSEWLVKGIDQNDLCNNSDLDWVNEIPSNWTVLRAKHIFQLRETKGNEVEVQLAATQKYGMYPQDELEGIVQVKEDTDLQTFRTVHKNDFVISLRSFQGGFEMSNFEGVCSPAYQVFFNKVDIYHPYFKMLFKSAAFIGKINSLTIGIREGKNILFKDFAEMFIAVPPIDEQKRIVEYINAAISEVGTVLSMSINSNKTSLLGNIQIVETPAAEEE